MLLLAICISALCGLFVGFVINVCADTKRTLIPKIVLFIVALCAVTGQATSMKIVGYGLPTIDKESIIFFGYLSFVLSMWIVIISSIIKRKKQRKSSK